MQTTWPLLSRQPSARKFLRDCRCKSYTLRPNLHSSQDHPRASMRQKPCKIEVQTALKNYCLHGISVAVYIAGQERRLVNPPSQVVAGVRTVTTNMNGRGTLPRCRACSLFQTTSAIFLQYPITIHVVVLQSVSGCFDPETLAPPIDETGLGLAHHER
jgi:hypothetical protein